MQGVRMASSSSGASNAREVCKGDGGSGRERVITSSELAANHLTTKSNCCMRIHCLVCRSQIRTV